jgi:16S rRNA (cytosine967-C5)-methyltransferase
MQAREAAFLALLHSLRGDRFINEVLEQWRKTENPTSQDFNLAREIAYGSARMALALDYLAKELTPKKTFTLKLKEKALLRTAFYQSYFMDRIPQYAIVDETLKVAKNYCHKTFSGFLNAILRKIGQVPLELPKGDSMDALSIRYSYPLFFIEQLVRSYDLLLAKKIMEEGNQPASTFVRIRPGAPRNSLEGLDVILEEPCAMALLKDPQLIPTIATSPDFYIQNITPSVLIANLAKELSPPQRILDLCASPGGKTIAVHDSFPKAELYANDISEEKLKRLSENFSKYHLNVHLSCSLGENYTSSKLFDLIILDVPCSNSGVLNKRPEARWRISKQALDELAAMQWKLIKNARSLLAPGGEIWYMTCSILPCENEELAYKACLDFNLKMRTSENILPHDNWDGGFACALRAKE